MTMTKNPPQTEASKKQSARQAFHLDKEAIRAAASKISEGAVTEGYRGNRQEVIAMLNDALATELLCVLRYKRHYYTAKGLEIEAIKGEFLQHAQEEQSHADLIAERIVQLNGEPDFNPKTLTERSHAHYDESADIKDMIRANLVEERVAIEAYRQMIERIGDDDPTTRHMLVQIMAQEEEHADDMSDLLGL
ncbi:MAG: ferritin-like domain-containing protein [Herbaspirillum sp.]|nr:ferritin-like domain-containing protein [Herbaspirillum sp.]